VRLLALILGLVIFTAPTAHAEKRLELVIGNAAYRNVTPPVNPRNADDVAASLSRLNFSVKKVVAGTFDDRRRALLQFSREAARADMVARSEGRRGAKNGHRRLFSINL
jgi:hypothetical protein